MHRIYIITLLLFSSVLTACGGGSSSDPVAISVATPASEVSFRAGESVDFVLETTSFNLAAPFNLRNQNLDQTEVNRHLVGESIENTVSNDSVDIIHDHDIDATISEASDDSVQAITTEINPNAREGHYHVYLDAASGADPHLTSWQFNDSYDLPEDIAVGSHTLRFELRDNNHTPVGVETIYFFQVVE